MPGPPSSCEVGTLVMPPEGDIIGFIQRLGNSRAGTRLGLLDGPSRSSVRL